jgi:hypothetical protein
VEKISMDIGWGRPLFTDSLNRFLYQPSLNVSISDFLEKAGIIYKNRYNKAVNERDKIYIDLVATLGGQDEFMRFRQNYYNKQLASVVTNEKEIQNYSVHDGEMIPLKEAVFRLPEKNSWRAHFYAPEKYALHQNIDTFWFNIFIILMFSFLLFILLYYDLIRRMFTYVETLRLNRLNKLRLTRLIKETEQNRPVRGRR